MTLLDSGVVNAVIEPYHTRRVLLAGLPARRGDRHANGPL